MFQNSAFVPHLCCTLPKSDVDSPLFRCPLTTRHQQPDDYFYNAMRCHHHNFTRNRQNWKVESHLFARRSQLGTPDFPAKICVAWAWGDIWHQESINGGSVWRSGKEKQRGRTLYINNCTAYPDPFRTVRITIFICQK